MTEPTRMDKKFDCVEMKRRGAEAVLKQLSGRTADEVLGYWRAKTDELRKRLKSNAGKRSA